MVIAIIVIGTVIRMYKSMIDELIEQKYLKEKELAKMRREEEDLAKIRKEDIDLGLKNF